MSRERRSTIVFWFLVVGFVFLCSAFVADGACVDFPPFPDRSSVIFAETAKLRSFDEAKLAFAKQTNDHGDFILPAPRSVSVRGRTASMIMDHPVDDGNYLYGQIWQLVYRSFHRLRGSCVIVDFKWPANPSIHQKAGGFTQRLIL